MYFCGPIHVASYDLCDGSFVLETETMGAQQANNNCCLDIMEVISFLSLLYLHKHQKPKRSSEFLDIPQIWEVSHINVLFTFRRLRMYQVNINLHSRVPNTKTAFLAQLSPQQQFLPISANLILHLIVCDLRPPDQKLLFSIFFSFSSFFPTRLQFQLRPVHRQSKTEIPIPVNFHCQLSLSTFIELIFDLHTCDVTSSGLLFCLQKSGSLSARGKQKSGVYKCSAFLWERCKERGRNRGRNGGFP